MFNKEGNTNKKRCTYIAAYQFLSTKGACRFARNSKHDSFELDRPQKERCLRFIQEEFSIDAGIAIRNQNDLMIRRVQFMRKTKDAATQVACSRNARGYYLKYGSSRFNNRRNYFDYRTTTVSPLPNQ